MISGSLQRVGIITGTITGVANVSGNIAMPTIITPETYDGQYDYTPTANEQVVEIAGLMARENIVIHPIPNNYGLITWDGATLTVS